LTAPYSSILKLRSDVDKDSKDDFPGRGGCGFS